MCILIDEPENFEEESENVRIPEAIPMYSNLDLKQ